MITHDEKTVKLEFRKDFYEGVLYRKWHDIGSDNDYLSRWAYHRMEVVLRSIDSYGLGRKGNALDIGIGSGVLLKELSKRGCDVWGADFSMNIIRNAYKRLGSINAKIVNRLMVAEIETLPIKSDSCDLVTCLGVLEYLPNNKNALGELYRIIRPRGYLILAVASYHRCGSLLNLVKNKIFRKKKVKPKLSPEAFSLTDRVRLVKPLGLRKETVEVGFKVKKFECFGGKLFGRYFPIRLYLPGLIYIGDHCLLVLEKPY